MMFIYYSFIFMCVFFIEINSKNYSDDSNEIVEKLYFEQKYLDSSLVTDNYKVKTLIIDKCKGSLNSLLSRLNTQSLINIKITNSDLADSVLNLSNFPDSKLKLEIVNSSANFNLLNFRTFNSFKIINSFIKNIDFNEFSDRIEVIIIKDFNPLFLNNIYSLNNLKNLKILEINSTSLFNDKIILDSLTKLKLLSLNNLSTMPLLNENCKLETLILSTIYKFTLIELNQLLKSCNEIEFLMLERMNLQEFPKEILNFKKLNTLILNNNKIFSLPKNIFQLESLEIISLDDNFISKIDSKIYSIENLSQINIEFNNLKTRIVAPKDRNIIINQQGNPFVK